MRKTVFLVLLPSAAYRAPVISEKRWQASSLVELSVLLAGSMMVGILLSGFASLFFKSQLTSNQMNLLRVVLSIICIQGASLLWIHLFVRRNETTWGEAFGLGQRNAGRCVAFALLALVFVFIGMTLLGNVSTKMLSALHESLHWKWLKPEQQEIVQILRNEWPWPLVALQGLAAVVIAPVSEELIFRGVIYSFIKQRGHGRLALWVSSLLFAMVHLHPVGFLSFIFMAMVLARLYDWTQNILAPILLHACFNGVSFALIVTNPKWAQELINQ